MVEISTPISAEGTKLTLRSKTGQRMELSNATAAGLSVSIMDRDGGVLRRITMEMSTSDRDPIHPHGKYSQSVDVDYSRKVTVTDGVETLYLSAYGMNVSLAKASKENGPNAILVSVGVEGSRSRSYIANREPKINEPLYHNMFIEQKPQRVKKREDAKPPVPAEALSDGFQVANTPNSRARAGMRLLAKGMVDEGKAQLEKAIALYEERKKADEETNPQNARVIQQRIDGINEVLATLAKPA